MSLHLTWADWNLHIPLASRLYLPRAVEVVVYLLAELYRVDSNDLFEGLFNMVHVKSFFKLKKLK